MLNWMSFRAFERGYATEAPIRVIPRVGSAYKPKGYSSHPPNPLSILLSFFSEQPLSLSLFKLVAVDDSSQVHPHNQSRWPPALSSHQLSAVTDKVNRLLTLSRVCSEKLHFRTTGYPSATNVQDPPHTGGIHLTRRSAKILCAGTVGSPDFLPLRTPVDQYPRSAIQSQPRAEYKDYSSIAHT